MKNITLNSTQEEKEEILNRQTRLNKQFKHTQAIYYLMLLVIVLLIIFAITETLGVTSLFWYSKVNNYIRLH